jgi:hypothetical protein
MSGMERGRRRRRGEKEKEERDFLKLHFIVDCTSLLILSFKVTPPFKSDSKQADYLLSPSSRII